MNSNGGKIEISMSRGSVSQDPRQWGQTSANGNLLHALPVIFPEVSGWPLLRNEMRRSFGVIQQVDPYAFVPDSSQHLHFNTWKTRSLCLENKPQANNHQD